MKLDFCLYLMCFLVFFSNLTIASHIEGDSDSQNTSLTREEINAYLTGGSLNLDKVAEINHFPNPKRVLQIKNLLGLDVPQKNRSTILYQLIRKYSIRIGREIVRKETQLNNLFQQSSVDLNSVKTLVSEIAVLKGELRFIHLKTRIRQKMFLTDEQVSIYSANKEFKLPTVYAFDE